jgi:Protein of unknown function (DUF4038)/Domain of unknown function (DUF5060)
VIDRCKLVLVAAFVFASSGRAEDAKLRTQANVMLEIPFQAQVDHQDPFNTIQLNVVFTAPDGSKCSVPAFWAGGKKWRVRYASPQVGIHEFRSECSGKRDAGLHNVTGKLQIDAYTGQNALYKHGPLRVAPNHRYLQHADGTPFFWLGDTWWMGLCHRIHWPDEVKTLAADRKEKGFNVIQLVAGLYPDMPPFDPRGANEAGFPWEEKYVRIRPEYFDAADRRIQYLVEQGFTPCIVGAWGYYMPWMGVDKIKQQWRYLIARYGAMPVVWCAAGEANLPWYLAKGFPYDDRKQVTQWTEVLRYIREADPYHRPLTIHPTGIGRLSARNATDDVTLLDFDMLQTPHAGREAVGATVATMQQSYADKPTMPVIDGEAAYEMLNDNLPTQWTRQMFWLCMTNGAAGHTYGANGVWQCNRRGQPHGPSPHGGNYGMIPWDEAMKLPGSRQVGLGKKLFEQYAWQEFAPHAEWVSYAQDNASSAPKWGQWIWFPEGDPAADAPAAKRYFRKTFDVPTDVALKSAILHLSADDRCVAHVNDQRVGERAGHTSFASLDITAQLKRGQNVLAIEVENLPAPSANPAGLLASLQLKLANGKDLVITSNDSWKCAKDVDQQDSWTTANFNDTKWVAAKNLGPYGRPPWGQFGQLQSYGPYATGISGKTRIIYVPESRPARILRLASSASFRAFVFDPESGATHDLTPLIADKDGGLTITRPPSVKSDDWVVVIEPMN